MLGFKKSGIKTTPRMSAEEYLSKLMEKGFDENGVFEPDSVPMAPPVGYRKQPSMVEIVRDMVRGENLRKAAQEAGHETFEESEDFDVDDDVPLESGYENDFDPPIGEIAKEVEAFRKVKEPPPEKPGAGGKPPAKSPPLPPEADPE